MAHATACSAPTLCHCEPHSANRSSDFLEHHPGCAGNLPAWERRGFEYAETISNISGRPSRRYCRRSTAALVPLGSKFSAAHSSPAPRTLLERQIRSLEQAFLKEGGLRERMTKARLGSR